MDVDELVNDGEKTKHGVDDNLLARWAAVVEELEEFVETVADEEAQEQTDHQNVSCQIILLAYVVVHIQGRLMME